MVLDAKQLDIPLLGLDTGKDPLVSEPGVLSILTNGEWQVANRINTRNGYTALGSTGLPSAAKSLLVADDKLFVVGQGATNTLRAYSEDRNDWANADYPAIFASGSGTESYQSVRTHGRAAFGSFVNEANRVPAIDAEVLQGHEVYVMKSDGLVNASFGQALIIERSSRQIVFNRAFGASGINIALVGSYNSKAFILWSVSSTTFSAYEVTLPSTSATLDAFASTTSITPVSPPAGTMGGVHLCSDAQNSRVWLVYINGSGNLAVYGRGTSDVEAASSVSAAGAVSCYKHPDENYLYIAYRHSSGEGRCITYNITGNSFSSAVTITSALTSIKHSTIVKASATTAFVAFDGTGAAPGWREIRAKFVNNTPATQAAAFSKEELVYGNVELAGQAIFANSRVFLPVVRGDSGSPQDALVQIISDVNALTGISAQPIALLATDDSPSFRTGNSGSESPAPHVPEVTSGTFLFPFPKPERIASYGGETYIEYSLRHVEIETAPSHVKTVTAYGLTYITGGYLGAVEDTIVPSTPSVGPLLALSAVASTGGFIDGNGAVYGYRAVVEEVGPSGAIHRGPAGPILEVTASHATSTCKIDLYCTYSPYTRNPRGTGRIMIYRTEGDGSIFRLCRIVLEAGSLDVIVDGLNDVDLSGNAAFLDHENGLSSQPVPGAKDLCVWNNRLWALSSLRPDRIYYSKELIDGVAAQFNEEEFKSVGSESAVGIQPLDNALLVFLEDQVFALTGDGPDDNGDNGAFSAPIRIVDGIGLSHRDAVASIPQGLLFQTPSDGWRLLGRDLQIQRREDGRYVGSEVDAYKSSTVVATTVVPSKHQARFVLSNYRVLVFDYQFERWGTFEITPAANAAFLSSVLWKDQHVLLDGTNNRVLKQGTLYSDNGEFIPLDIEIDWLSFGGIAGFQRARRGTWTVTQTSNVPMTAKVNTDTGSEQAIAWTEAEITALTDDRLQVHVRDQKCSRIKARITSSAPASGQPEGYSLSGFQLELGLLRGQTKLPAANRKG